MVVSFDRSLREGEQNDPQARCDTTSVEENLLE